MTRGQKIRSMNDKELLEFINSVYIDEFIDGDRDDMDSSKYSQEWLEQEAEE